MALGLATFEFGRFPEREFFLVRAGVVAALEVQRRTPGLRGAPPGFGLVIFGAELERQAHGARLGRVRVHVGDAVQRLASQA